MRARGAWNRIGGYVVSLIDNFVPTREQPGKKIICIRTRAAMEKTSQPNGRLEVIALPRYLVAASAAVSIILAVLCSTVVVASLAAWSMLH